MSTLNTDPSTRTHGTAIKATRKERIMESIANYSAETQQRIEDGVQRIDTNHYTVTNGPYTVHLERNVEDQETDKWWCSCDAFASRFTCLHVSQLIRFLRSGPSKIQPQYSSDTKARIQAAISRAQASTRRAHLLGKNAKHGYTVYQVYSSKPRPTPYTLRVYQYPVPNAFRYLSTMHYILCECQASQNGCPCHHAAIVAHRLHREAGGTQAQETAGAAPEPARRKYTLEDLYADAS